MVKWLQEIKLLYNFILQKMCLHDIANLISVPLLHFGSVHVSLNVIKILSYGKFIKENNDLTACHLLNLLIFLEPATLYLLNTFLVLY